MRVFCLRPPRDVRVLGCADMRAHMDQLAAAGSSFLVEKVQGGGWGFTGWGCWLRDTRAEALLGGGWAGAVASTAHGGSTRHTGELPHLRA